MRGSSDRSDFSRRTASRNRSSFSDAEDSVDDSLDALAPLRPSPTRRFAPAAASSTPHTMDFRGQSEGSLSEEQRRFLSPSPLRTGSWESHSFDSEEPSRSLSSRPSSRTSIPRDRRKQFDTTTPTLVDEEDIDEEAELLSLGRASLSPSLQDNVRRTPGATTYNAALTVNETTSMRRTPGAAAMHRSAIGGQEELGLQRHQQAPPNGVLEERASSRTSNPVLDETSGAGSMEYVYGLNLSTPARIAAVPSERESALPHNHSTLNNSSIWEAASYGDSVTPSPTRSRDYEQPSRPPLAPVLPVVTASSEGGLEARGLFASTSTWVPKSTPSNDGRHGAFSPNLLRLTEDIGNLLHEDEDDDEYAAEIPSAFKAPPEGDLSEYRSADWTGSYVFDSQSRRTTRSGIPRPSTLIKDGKSRRRSGNTSQGNSKYLTQQNPGIPGNFLRHAQQPKPRRNGNEFFEFGKGRDERASPQLLNFGGAFAPPPKDQVSSFMRPVASSAVSDEMTFGPSVVSGCRDLPSSQPMPFSAPAMGGFALPAQSFESYGSFRYPDRASQDNYFLPNRFSATSPVVGLPPSGQYPVQMSTQYQSQQSEMQATAREFVPTSNMSPSPPLSTSSWQHQSRSQQLQPQCAAPPQASSNLQQHLPMMAYDLTPAEQGGWHSNASYGFSSKFGYGMPSPTFDARSAMTPSPHLALWQNPDTGIYGGTPQASQTETTHSVYVASVRPPSTATASSDQGPRDHQVSKKESKRGKRGKKKLKEKPLNAPQNKGKEEDSRPGSATHNQETTEDPGERKRAELVENAATRIAFKEFYRCFRSEERFSFQKAEEFALDALDNGSLPVSVHWRVYLELADLAKRSNRFVEARSLYQRVCQQQPYASQGWLEYSKLEEECGHMNRVTNILHAGLEYCEYSENLLTRAVKHQEKMGNVNGARELLARLKHVGIDKVWRTVLEGALLESRAGNAFMARRVLKYLMHHVPWYGPLYLEAYKLERDLGRPTDALQIVKRGLNEIPRYGPLWFGAFRLCEEIDLSKLDFYLPEAFVMINRATLNISKELVWKVHLEAAQMLERAALEQSGKTTPLNSAFDIARHRFALTVLTCPSNLRWKVWLASGRMELGIGNIKVARKLFLRAHHVVPDKGRSASLLECARLEEFIGCTHLARSVLCKGRVLYCNDWKVWLESVLLEIRTMNLRRALEIVTVALEIHQGTGRLWATLIQLCQIRGGDQAQIFALQRALNAVPKSGEVWCEGARIHLNPFSDTFDVSRARRHLFFATKFTPQYGDSFIEALRLELLHQWLEPIATYIWKKTKSTFLPLEAQDAKTNCLSKYIADISLAVFISQETNENEVPFSDLIHKNIVSTVRQELTSDSMRSAIDLDDLRQACSNADPNYGSLWFSCRRHPCDTPQRVIEDAAEDVAEQLRQNAYVYLAAMVRRLAILSTISTEMPANEDLDVEMYDTDVVSWEYLVDDSLRSATSLSNIFLSLEQTATSTTGLGMLQQSAEGSDFLTALSHLRKNSLIQDLPLLERRKILFGTDALFP
jgi:tetratricopeptide (TPR) repeat protein